MKDGNPNNKLKMQWWKIAALVIVIVLIVAATSYSLISKANASSSGLLSKGNVPSITPITSITSITSQSVPTAVGIGELKWTESLPAKFADHDFVFVILPSNDINSTEILSKRVSDASAKIEGKGARVETLVLSASDPEFSITMKRFAIDLLPAVLAISSAGKSAIMVGEITEGTLLRTYLTVLPPPAVCAPGSGCCGGN